MVALCFPITLNVSVSRLSAGVTYLLLSGKYANFFLTFTGLLMECILVLVEYDSILVLKMNPKVIGRNHTYYWKVLPLKVHKHQDCWASFQKILYPLSSFVYPQGINIYLNGAEIWLQRTATSKKLEAVAWKPTKGIYVAILNS